ncbi:MAG: hypothetical protein QOD49_1099, partial [Actinomycetota bacterium]|nr:hypothetical protein [Actinomycetota bacterium]
ERPPEARKGGHKRRREVLLDLVIWSFMIALAPLTLGLACQQTAAIVQGLASTLSGPSAWPDDGDRFPSHV